MVSEFARVITRLIDGKYRSKRAFIRAAEPGRDEDSAQAYLAQVLSGKKPPPLERLDGWFAALGIDRADAQHLRDLAAIAHLPDDSQDRFVAILRRVSTLAHRVAELEERYDP